MGIGHYIKEIGRGKDGARALTREQSADLLGQILDDQVSDLEVGAFCLAMRIKGETPHEMAGFLDAIHARINPLSHPSSTTTSTTVVIPLQRCEETTGPHTLAGSFAGTSRCSGLRSWNRHRIRTYQFFRCL